MALRGLLEKTGMPDAARDDRLHRRLMALEKGLTGASHGEQGRRINQRKTRPGFARPAPGRRAEGEGLLCRLPASRVSTETGATSVIQEDMPHR